MDLPMPRQSIGAGLLGDVVSNLLTAADGGPALCGCLWGQMVIIAFRGSFILTGHRVRQLQVGLVVLWVFVRGAAKQAS